MIWTQLVYGTIVVASTNFPIATTPQFYSAPVPHVSIADVVEVIEGAQERVAAANATAGQFDTIPTNSVDYYVRELAFLGLEDTDTWYRASTTGVAFNAWQEFALYDLVSPDDGVIRPPILDWRLSKTLLNKAVERVTAAAPSFLSNTSESVYWDSNALWSAAGSTNGAPSFYYGGDTTGKLWQLFRAIRLLKNTRGEMTFYNGTVIEAQTNNVTNLYYSADDPMPDWFYDPSLLPAAYSTPSVSPDPKEFTGISGGISYEHLAAAGPLYVQTYTLTTTPWNAYVTIGGGLSETNVNSITYAASGTLDVANMGAGVVCSGRLCAAVAITGSTNLSAISTGDWWTITHTGVSTTWAGRAVWDEPIRLTNFMDPTAITNIGAWESVGETNASGGIWDADPRAFVALDMSVSASTSTIYWTFTRCTN